MIRQHSESGRLIIDTKRTPSCFKVNRPLKRGQGSRLQRRRLLIDLIVRRPSTCREENRLAVLAAEVRTLTQGVTNTLQFVLTVNLRCHRDDKWRPPRRRSVVAAQPNHQVRCFTSALASRPSIPLLSLLFLVSEFASSVSYVALTPL